MIKKSIISLIWLMLIFSSKLNAQKLIIEDTLNLKKGVYRTFDEFKFNSPSLKFDFDVIDKTTKVYSEKKIGRDYHKRYKIDLTNYHPQKYETVFGFCDGENVYLCNYHTPLTEDAEFDRVEFLGIYSLYYEYRVQAGSTTPGGIPGGIPSFSSSKVIRFCALDIKNGDKIYPKKNKVRDILSDDAELLKEYNNSEKLNSSKTIIKYLKKYSYKHIGNSDLNRKKAMNAKVANEFVKRHPVDSTLSDYYNRLNTQFVGNPTFIEYKMVENTSKNGILLKKGIKVKHDFDGYPRNYYKIGIWSYYSETGEIEKEIEYNIFGEKIRKKIY